MLTTGVDLVHVHRLAEVLERHGERFLRRVYTAEEIAYCAGRPAALAARFAAKEAASKALGVGMRGLNPAGIHWQEAEVRNDSSGRPQLLLHGSAALLAQKQGWREWSLSLAHERDMAIAFVTALG
ncbi:MAG: holo-ACP synthase [Chloroflexi bacterium]|nr:holo-ACP synthase [Chloroflexota bacterium]